MCFLNHLKNQARKALGDFGVPIAILIMFLVDYGISINGVYTEKLKYVVQLMCTLTKNYGKYLNYYYYFFSVPNGFELTNRETRSKDGHGWFINPLPEDFPVYVPFISILPAILFYVLLFVTTEVSE